MFGNSQVNTFNKLLSKVYAWMSAGLLLTAGTAYYVGHSPAMLKVIVGNPWVLFGLILAQLGMVIFLSAGIRKLSFGAALATFLGYSLLNGLTLSFIFLVYTQASIALTFLVAAGMFAAMALYGYFTRADLSGMGSFLMMGIFGLVIAGIANMFFQSNSFSYVLSGAGVVIFSLLTAYDVQRLKTLSQYFSGKDEAKLSVIGALTLYLDFINLFLYLLRFMGNKKD
ncbi:hypothetical protein A3F66_01835 [candidate division TM6 bacterium RIFCSPHIGHO2_12_FULL_32_22]|nr:MAG: hypothetical protein A3F66_01835 [candidate division TM6 bacterium RIFCSPHIGHO2_12_FULL_32_22]